MIILYLAIISSILFLLLIVFYNITINKYYTGGVCTMFEWICIILFVLLVVCGSAVGIACGIALKNFICS